MHQLSVETDLGWPSCPVLMMDDEPLTVLLHYKVCKLGALLVHGDAPLTEAPVNSLLTSGGFTTQRHATHYTGPLPSSSDTPGDLFSSPAPLARTYTSPPSYPP
jgi:hypothetical protein